MANENTNNQQVKSKRDTFRERISKRYPEMNMDDEDAVYGQLSTDYDQFDQNKQKMDDFNNMLKEYPMAPGLVTGLTTKKNPDGSDFSLIGYLIDNMGEDLRAALDGDEQAKKRLASKEKKSLTAETDKAKAQEALAKNMEAEDAELDAFIKEQKIKPEAIQPMIDWIYNQENGFVKRALNYELHKEDFQRLLQIKDFDQAMKDAEEKGYVRGKNETIDQNKELRNGKGGKRITNVSGGGGPASLKREPSRMEEVYGAMAERGM